MANQGYWKSLLNYDGEEKVKVGLRLKSAYTPYDSRDGKRYLVETFWPEGIDTYFLSPYAWVRELAPSYDMKEKAIWEHWSEEKFREKYETELQEPERRVGNCSNLS